jgi:hypothetical protein
MSSKTIKNRKKNEKAKARREGALMRNVQAFSGEALFSSIVHASPIAVSNATSGIALAIQISISQVASVSTQFQVFQKARIMSVDFRVTPVAPIFGTIPGTGTVQGATKMYIIDEPGATAPTITEAQQTTGKLVPNNSSSSAGSITMTWRNVDVGTLDYLPVTDTSSLGSFRLFSNPGNYGNGGLTGVYFIVEPVYHMQFKGLI